VLDRPVDDLLALGDVALPVVGAGAAEPRRVGEAAVERGECGLLRNNNRGYCKCTLTADTWTSEYRYVSTVRQPKADVLPLATFVVENGVPGARRVAPV